MTIRDQCAEALKSPNVAAFLRVIREGESSQDGAAYRMQVGGRLIDSLDAHPRQIVTLTIGGKEVRSSAAGAYQFLGSTWDGCAKALGLTDFSAESQDLAAVYLIRRRGALDDVIAGRFESAVMKCNREWASLPGSPYGQPTKSMAQAWAVYREYGGSTAAGAQPEQTEKRIMPLPAILAAVLPSIVEAIPRLGKLFGSGSEVAERNVKAAELAVEIVKDATGAVNAQEAAEKIKADPAAAGAAAAAVEQRWFDLTQEIGGGIDGAHQRDLAYSQPDGPRFWHSPVFWVTVMLVPLVYVALYAVLFREGFSNDIKAMVLGAIFGGLLTGGIQAYFYGTSNSSQRKTELMSK